MGRLVTAGRVGRPHGLDGAFIVLDVQADLRAGLSVHVGDRERLVERRAGTDERPLIRLDGVATREEAAELGGELLLVEEDEAAVPEGEWLAGDLIGCRIEGMGEVRRVLGGPSCDVLELDSGDLVPLISDAVRSVDIPGRSIDVDRRFLGLA